MLSLALINMKVKTVYLVLLVLIISACGTDDYLPKPKAYLRLEYPEANYELIKINKTPVAFDVNSLVHQIKTKTLESTTESYGVNLEYPALKATIFLTYKAVNNNQKNLNAFLRDAQKLTLEHTKKADEIPVYPYQNLERKVYGVLSEVKGDAASPLQFYVTDSIQHFLTGSLYFKTKPNYDSILPAANYLKKDIKRIMETVTW